LVEILAGIDIMG